MEDQDESTVVAATTAPVAVPPPKKKMVLALKEGEKELLDAEVRLQGWFQLRQTRVREAQLAQEKLKEEGVRQEALRLEKVKAELRRKRQEDELAAAAAAATAAATKDLAVEEAGNDGQEEKGEHSSVVLSFKKQKVAEPLTIRFLRYANPHVAQYIHTSNKNAESRIPFARELTDDTPGMKYRRRTTEFKSVLQWQQRRMLIAALEFLTCYSHEGDTVLYGGGARCNHTGLLSDLFPHAKFTFVDQTRMRARSSRRVTLLQEQLNEAIATQYRSPRTLFISYIHTTDYTEGDSLPPDERAKVDMQLNHQLIDIIQPRHSMLRFQLPWTKGDTMYLDGDLTLPIWSPATSSECMLVTGTQQDGQRVIGKHWSNQQYEAQMFRFNTETRVQLYPHQVCAPGLDHCYDCAAEVTIIRDYVERFFGAEYLATGRGLSPLATVQRNREVRLAEEDAQEKVYKHQDDKEEEEKNQKEKEDTETRRNEHHPLDHKPDNLKYRPDEALDAAVAELSQPSPLTAGKDPTVLDGLDTQPFPTQLELDHVSDKEGYTKRLLEAVAELSDWFSKELFSPTCDLRRFCILANTPRTWPAQEAEERRD